MKTFNIFKPTFEYDDADPEGFRAGMDRFGPRIGASRIGASIYELPPGQALCPYHYESDEEWIVVLEGSVSVRHPEGTDVLGPGDTAAFAVGPDGAHQVFNASEDTVRLMMLSTKDEVWYSVYPDSNKIQWGNGRERSLVRLGENLEYYD
ncbi:cupin domain-containing protein [Solirubrobacter soli]|uniref:cupin domain-containing protein n=1 Tax=Solirubrobacter soli TaxID=363832 RepID=UPI0004226C54|nr:cupin domain-containing protein [Solirubrobacter soli]